MPDESLILKPADGAGNAFITLYEHPQLGRIDVGRVTPRASQHL
jgi:hypothetical protein